MEEAIFPRDSRQRAIGSRARILVSYVLNCEHWEFRPEVGPDYGCDCVIELVTEGEWHNERILGQIKGTENIERYKLRTNDLSFPLEKRTINYALESNNAFLLFLVDNINQTVYYLPIQDYFIENPALFEKSNQGAGTINLHIPISNVVTHDDLPLQLLAQSNYIRTQNGLEKIVSENRELVPQ